MHLIYTMDIHLHVLRQVRPNGIVLVKVEIILYLEAMTSLIGLFSRQTFVHCQQ